MIRDWKLLIKLHHIHMVRVQNRDTRLILMIIQIKIKQNVI